MHRVLLVVGTRPNLMKAAPILDAARTSELRIELVHTGQHYDSELRSLLLTDLGMPEPDHRLEVGKLSPLGQIAAILTGLERIADSVRPSLIIAVGDVTSTLAAAMTANKLGIRLAHVEAGLRSHDPEMPEEWNRRATDLFADILFCTERSGVASLLGEGKRAEQVFLVGNVMIDTLLRLKGRAAQARTAEELGVTRPFALVTLHRPSNVDDPAKLEALFEGALAPLAHELPVIFPVHPRTRARLNERLLRALPASLHLVSPLGYVAFLSLMTNAKLVLTDSGGIQEETTALRVPCLTVRENTERPITVEVGTNELVGTRPEAVLAHARRVLAGDVKRGQSPPLWDGRTAQRIVSITEAYLGGGLAAAAESGRAHEALLGREALDGHDPVSSNRPAAPRPGC